jgi:hypothetical protein
VQVLLTALEMEVEALPTTLQQDRDALKRTHLLSDRRRLVLQFRCVYISIC